MFRAWHLWGVRRVELHGFGHVALDLYLAVHEGILWLQLSLYKPGEIVVEHDEGGVGLAHPL
jgi:hypothetical protein